MYRPVAVDEVEGRLRERFESRSELVVDHRSALADRRGTTTDQRRDVRRIEGAAIVNSRTIKLLETADATVTYVVGAGVPVGACQRSAVERLVSAGVDATVITDDGVRDRFELTGVEVIVPVAVEGSTSLGRLLIVDDDGLLLSVRGREETAIRSLDTMFSRTIANLARGALANTVDGYETP